MSTKICHRRPLACVLTDCWPAVMGAAAGRSYRAQGERLVFRGEALPARIVRGPSVGYRGSTSPYDSDFSFGYIRSINRLAASVFCSSVFDTRQRLVTSTSSTSITLLEAGCLSNVPVTTSDANSILSRITILWFRYCVLIGFMTSFYLEWRRRTRTDCIVGGLPSRLKSGYASGCPPARPGVGRRGGNRASRRKPRRSELPVGTVSQLYGKISPEADHE